MLLSAAAARAQPAPAVSPAPPPAVTADDKGLGVKSADGLFGYRLHGFLQVDGRWYLGDDELHDRDTFLLRRARPILEATMLGMVDLRLMPDFGEGRAQIFDAYIDVRARPWLKLRLGKYKPPIGLERLQSDADMPMLERALTANLAPTRDVGVQLHGDVLAGLLQYAIGVYDGAVDNASADQDTNHAKDFAARLFVHPFATVPRLGTLGLGLSASTGNQLGTPAAPGLPTYRTAGQTAFFSYLTSANPAATVFAYHRRSRLNPELYYYLGGLGLLAEYVANMQTVRKGDVTADLTHHAWHATVSYALGGKTSFDGVVPRASYRAGAPGWGAVELAVRVSRLTLDEDTFPQFAADATTPREVTGYSVALGWWPSRNVRAGAHYERTEYHGAPSPPRGHEDALVARGQVNF